MREAVLDRIQHLNHINDVIIGIVIFFYDITDIKSKNLIMPSGVSVLSPTLKMRSTMGFILKHRDIDYTYLSNPRDFNLMLTLTSFGAFVTTVRWIRHKRFHSKAPKTYSTYVPIKAYHSHVVKCSLLANI